MLLLSAMSTDTAQVSANVTPASAEPEPKPGLQPNPEPEPEPAVPMLHARLDSARCGSHDAHEIDESDEQLRARLRAKLQARLLLQEDGLPEGVPPQRID